MDPSPTPDDVTRPIPIAHDAVTTGPTGEPVVADRVVTEGVVTESAVDPALVDTIPPEPPFWQRWWFWVAVAVPILLILAAIALAARDNNDEVATTATSTTIAGATTTLTSPPNTETIPQPTATTAVPAPTTTVAPAPTAPPPTSAVGTVPAPTAPPTPAPTAPAPAPTPAPTAPPTPAPTASPTPTTAAPVTFTDGTHRVGTDIPAGRYVSPGSNQCQWARRSNASGSQAVLGGATSAGQVVIDVLPNDAFLDTKGCGTFTALAPPSSTNPGPPPATSLNDGSWVVGQQIAAGTWHTQGGPQCTWMRLSDFTGTPQSILQQGQATGPTDVTIQPSDVGFASQGCGSWTKTA
jgi:hypothetical protein